MADPSPKHEQSGLTTMGDTVDERNNITQVNSFVEESEHTSLSDEKATSTHLSTHDTRVSNDVEAGAIAHNEQEHNMTALEAYRKYTPAVYWALGMSLQMAMEGYNISVTPGLLVFQPFAMKYGEFFGPRLGYQITFPWQMAITLGATAGGVIGAAVSGPLIEKIGARWTIMLSHVFLTGSIFIQFYAHSIEMLFAGTLVNGLPWGTLAMVGAIYTSEVIPTVLRGYFINFTNFSNIAGHLICAGVLQALEGNKTEWSYRIPYAVQWMWPVPLFLIAYFAPNSPWWLVRKGKPEEARKAVQRLTRNLSEEEIDQAIAAIRRTDAYEKQMKTESSYADCFKGSNLPRTEVACVALCAQSFTGSPLGQSPTYFFRQAGLSNTNVFKLNTGAQGVAMLGNIICWGLMAVFGRRPLFIVGCTGLTICMFLIGILDVADTQGAVWAQCAICVVWLAIFSAFVAPESYTIAGEISATRVRAQTLALSKLAFGITACATGVMQIYMINPTSGNLKGKSAYPWFAFSLLYVIWSIFRLPESKDRTYEELDILFERKISARAFKRESVTLPTEREGSSALRRTLSKVAQLSRSSTRRSTKKRAEAATAAHPSS